MEELQQKAPLNKYFNYETNNMTFKLFFSVALR